MHFFAWDNSRPIFYNVLTALLSLRRKAGPVAKRVYNDSSAGGLTELHLTEFFIQPALR